MIYDADDIVTTRDGRKHRVLWIAKCRTVLFVKPVGKSGKHYRVKIENIVAHQPRKKPC